MVKTQIRVGSEETQFKKIIGENWKAKDLYHANQLRRHEVGSKYL